MKSRIKDERGAVLIVELVVLALVLAAAGFATYQYLEHKSATSNAVTPRPHVAKTTPSPSASPNPANEFDVPELGFKMMLPTGLTELEYSIVYQDPSHAPVGARFSTKQVDQIAPEHCTVADGPIGSIYVSSVDPKTLADPRLSNDARKVGGKWLSYLGPEHGCYPGSSDSPGNKLQTSTSQLMHQAFNTAALLP